MTVEVEVPDVLGELPDVPGIVKYILLHTPGGQPIVRQGVIDELEAFQMNRSNGGDTDISVILAHLVAKLWDEKEFLRIKIAGRKPYGGMTGNYADCDFYKREYWKEIRDKEAGGDVKFDIQPFEAGWKAGVKRADEAAASQLVV